MNAITQLYVFPNSEYQHHWRDEVWNKYSESKVLRRSHKRPNRDFFYKNLWRDSYKSSMQARINGMIRKEASLEPDADRRSNPETLSALIQDYYWWLAGELSSKDVVDPNDVHDKLESMGL